MIVECINDRGLPSFLKLPPKAGKFYTVIQEHTGKKGRGYVLDECFEIYKGEPVSYLIERFKPFEEINIESLLVETVSI